ncbi:MAG: hypothetical protein ACKV2Q_16905 [Planctomycetaceae bacterium]
MARSSVRLNNWNHLGGKAVWALVLLVGGIAIGVSWLTGDGVKPDPSKAQLPSWMVPIVIVGVIASGCSWVYLVFRRYALWVELGDQFRYRMLLGGGTRKWSSVKNVKLAWEYLEEADRTYMQIEFVLKGNRKIWVCLSEKQAARFKQFAQSRFSELGVQYSDQT